MIENKRSFLKKRIASVIFHHKIVQFIKTKIDLTMKAVHLEVMMVAVTIAHTWDKVMDILAAVDTMSFDHKIHCTDYLLLLMMIIV